MAISRRALFGLVAGAVVAPVIGKAEPAYATGGIVPAGRRYIVGERVSEYVVRTYADLPSSPGPREGDLARVVNIVN